MNKSKKVEALDDIGIKEISKDGKNKENDEKDKADDKQLPPVNYFKLFRYASNTDLLLLIAGSLAAAGAGMSMPLMVIYFGRITKSMVSNGNADPEALLQFCSKYNITAPSDPGDTSGGGGESFTDVVSEMALVLCYIGIGTWILNFIFVSSFNIVAENQTFRIRKLYLEALLRQNIGWYDTVSDKNFVSRISEDLVKVQESVGEKVGLCIFFSATFLFSIGNAFYHGWKLTLVVLSAAPVLSISTAIVAGIQSRMVKTEQDSYAKAGNIAQEAITNVKTVMAFSGATQEVIRYEEALDESKSAGKKKGAFSSFGMALMFLIIYCAYALAFWYGNKLILGGREDVCNNRKPEYTAENMIIVFFSVMMGAFNIGQSASYMEAFASGRGAAAGIFSVIDRKPEIDSYSESGKKPSQRARGLIQFKNLHFHYPSRPDIPILKGLNLTVKPGQTVAFVGHSGCGKSTCIQLLQRFYDPIGGSVSLDGENIRDLHIGWLRSQIGVVSQEPILFNTTIAENIRYGRDDVTQEEIESACRQSNAHAFISKLPNKYETLVGDRGAALSGGQKQRIAIARSLVRNPAILLLDEATSALDTQSESIVQAALDNASQGRTTLIVAHRLSTIRNADVVVAINNGQVVEQGTHEELLQQKGLYHSLVLAQMQGQVEGDSELEEDLAAAEKGDTQRPRRLSRQLSKQDSRYSIGGGSLADEEEILLTSYEEDNLSDKELAKQAPTIRLLKMNASEWPYILIGTISAAIQGAITPVYAIIFGEVMQTFAEPDEEKAQRDANKFALYFVGIGVIAGVSMFLQMLMFTLAGEALTQRLRRMTFAAMLKQELGWFDIPSNNIGALCSRLAGDAASVQGATGSQIGMILQAVSTISISIGVAMYYKAKLGAVALAFVPVVLCSTYFQGMLLHGANMGEKKALDESSKIAVQAVANIRTVASLSKERMFVKMYNDLLQTAHDNTFKINLLRGFIFGLAQGMPSFANAAIMYYGAYLVDHEGMAFGDIFKVSQSLIMGTMMVGQALSFQPNYNKAVISGARILRLLDRKPKIDTSLGVGLQIPGSKGQVKFSDVAFHYPTRPSAKILRSLSMSVEAGQSVALVGPSGCGKSTTIQLALRYYDPLNGVVRLDDHDVAALQVECLRSQMAIVAQEPSLFDRTIAQNIAYGDNSRQIPMEEIIQAAKMANIHNFISALPAGYETRVGEMGTQLSGGQKQRVAIARALVRNPKILLLDEATSALDTESEKVVQEALDQASSGRTSITIAHRLSSIVHSDKIIVINHGEVHEEGSHKQLLEKRGLYHRLWSMQGGRH